MGLQVKIRLIIRLIAALLVMMAMAATQMSQSILQTKYLELLLFTLITTVGQAMFRQVMPLKALRVHITLKASCVSFMTLVLPAGYCDKI